MRNAPLLAMLFVVAGAAHAADWSPAPAEFATATPRETFLATGIAGMMTIGLASFCDRCLSISWKAWVQQI